MKQFAFELNHYSTEYFQQFIFQIKTKFKICFEQTLET